MVNENQAGKLILSQIGMFNEAVNLHGNVIEPALLGAIDDGVEEFAKTYKWKGEFGLACEELDCWLAPAQWNVGEDENAAKSKAWFAVDYIGGGDDDYWTALFCGQGRDAGEAGFVFTVDEGIFGKKRAWNNNFKGFDGVRIDELKKHGFKILDDNSGRKTFFLPIYLDSEMLSETWGANGKFSSTDACFDPVRAALNHILAAWPIFDAILEICPVKAGFIK